MSDKMRLLYSNTVPVSMVMKARCRYTSCSFSDPDQAVVTRHEQSYCPARFLPVNQPLTYEDRKRRSARNKGKGKATTSNNPPPSDSSSSNNPQPEASLDDLMSFIDDPNQKAIGSESSSSVNPPPEGKPARKNRLGKGKGKAAPAAPSVVLEGQGFGIGVGAGLEIQHPVDDLGVGEGVGNEPIGEDIGLESSSDDDPTPPGTSFGHGSRFSVLTETPASINTSVSSVSCGSDTSTRAVGSSSFHSAYKPFRQASIPFSLSSHADRIEVASTKPYRASQSGRGDFGGRFPASTRMPSLGSSRPYRLTRVAAPQPTRNTSSLPTAAASLHRASTPLPAATLAVPAAPPLPRTYRAALMAFPAVPPPIPSNAAAAAAAAPRTYRAALMALPVVPPPILPPHPHVLPGCPLLPGMMYLQRCCCSRGLPHLVAPPIPPGYKNCRPPP